MTTYSVFNVQSGNLVDSFQSEHDARRVLEGCLFPAVIVAVGPDGQLLDVIAENSP